MIRDEIKGNIYLEDTELYDFMEGCDQTYDSFPCVFPTFSVSLVATEGLNAIADDIRRNYGLKTLFDNDCNGGDCANCHNDCTAWYNYLIDLNGYNDHHIDNRIFVWISELADPDDGETFYIDLNEEEQEYIYQRINEELQERFGETCESVLKDASENMREVAGGELTILERRL